MKLTDMREVLERRGIRLTRSLGQSFLHDTHQLDRIVAAAALSPADRVLEIGPGLGPLTERLLAVAGRVWAIEKDARLAAVLRERWGAEPRLELTVADALEVARDPAVDWSGWTVVSNLPYSVASPLLVELASSACPPERMVVTLQLEVVRRLMAGPGTPDYGVLTLLVQLRYVAAGWFRIPAGCFFPVPGVDSGCVTLCRRPDAAPGVGEARLYRRLVKRSFSQRRKMLKNLLRAEWPEAVVEAVLRAVGLPGTIRGERVSRETYLAMARHLAGSGDREGGEVNDDD